MSHSSSARAALARTLVVLVVLGGALGGMAGTTLAAPVGQDPSTSGATVSSGPAFAGVSLGTFTWAMVGFTLLVLGFVAASRSGRRGPNAIHPSFGSTGADRSVQPSTHGTQGEPTAAAVII